MAMLSWVTGELKVQWFLDFLIIQLSWTIYVFSFEISTSILFKIFQFCNLSVNIIFRQHTNAVVLRWGGVEWFWLSCSYRLQKFELAVYFFLRGSYWYFIKLHEGRLWYWIYHYQKCSYFCLESRFWRNIIRSTILQYRYIDQSKPAFWYVIKLFDMEASYSTSFVSELDYLLYRTSALGRRGVLILMSCYIVASFNLVIAIVILRLFFNSLILWSSQKTNAIKIPRFRC